ncbi:3-hydroxyacyl-CoA dehydrogenase [Staphylococcus caprae]|uniref:3-hydroxyacyl-CoA dehydrogenase n=1 Tax=Staphylococcus caprae TaxID=29380 RepID=UPI00351A5FA9
MERERFIINFENITIAGGGVLGTQVAFQTAWKGYKVTIYDISEDALINAKERVENLKSRYQEDMNLDENKTKKIVESIKFEEDLEEAVRNSDLVIETIPEKLSIKQAFYKELADFAPSKTIFVTNSSQLLPSKFKDATGRPKQFAALHFANEVWKRNTAEVMRTDDTDDNVFDAVLKFAESIGMVALPIYKEKSGYILNSILMPFNAAGAYLLSNKIADFKTIDKTWISATGNQLGPIGLVDLVGLNSQLTVFKEKYGHINNDWHAKYIKILEKMVDENRIGITVNKGFYEYPNPEFTQKEFFKNTLDIQNSNHSFEYITILGGGIIGTQLAIKIAEKGFNVTIYDKDKACSKRFDDTLKIYQKETTASDQKLSEIKNCVNIEMNLDLAIEERDLLIEAIPEIMRDKQQLFEQLATKPIKDKIIVTVTDTFKPTDFSNILQTPKKFAAFHIINRPWKNNVVEIMTSKQTSPETINKLAAFGKDLDFLVTIIEKEQSSYITNTLLLPHLQEALKLYVNEIANFKDIDKTWIVALKTKQGPFALMDSIGLNTIYNIQKTKYEQTKNAEDKKVVIMLEEKIKNGHIGLESGKGFYTYE